MHSIPRLLRLILAITLLTLLILFGMRLVFWLMFSNPADPVAANDLLYSFYLGTKFDLRLTLIVLIPLFVLGWIKWFSPFHSRVAHYVWLGYLVLAATAVLIFYLVDFGHYAYLHKRVDATMLRFLDNFDTSVEMVWQSYAVIPWTLFLLFLITLDAFVVHHLLRYFARQRAPVIKKRHKLWIAPLAFFMFIFGMYGKFSFYPLRWSDAFFSPQAYAAAVATNPVLYFFETLKNKQVTFDEERTREYYDLISNYLGVTRPDKAALDFSRQVSTRNRHTSTPNVVIVILESFAGYKTGRFGNPLDPTPYFDRLAQDGALFTRFYTPHTGTARSVFATITGLPDIEVNKTSSRNPLVVDQHTIINHFKGYEKFYFIGGSANWGNIRGILQHNIHGLRLHEEGSFTRPRMDMWGLDDLSLFIETNEVLRKQDKPFFAIVQTSGNHRPYHIPEDNAGFELRQEDQKTLGKAGFIGNDEFNAFRFMDHSLGKYMELARQEGYFDNTLFFFFGDHGITGYAGEHSPSYLTHTLLSGMHTPLLVYAPKLLPAQVIDRIGSELDVLPTAAGLAGIDYINTTLGRDLFDPQFDDRRFAFTITHSKNSELGLVSNDFYYMVFENGDKPRLFALNGEHSQQNLVEQHPQITQQMRELTFGLFETTRYLLYHNKPRSTD